MNSSRQSVGRWGEIVAAKYLEEHGFQILTRNVRTPHGELDLIASLPEPEGDVLVFVEVKTRRSSTYGHPEESITPKKKDHLLKSAQAYLLDHPELSGTWRIDVIAIQLDGDSGDCQLRHFENAVN